MLAADVGFAAATTNPFTVNIAQGIAELPLNSGIGLRLAFFAVAMTITILYVLRYGARIRAESRRVADARRHRAHARGRPATTTRSPGGTRSRWCCAAVIFACILWGVQALGWWLSDMAGGFFLMGIVARSRAGLPLADGTKAYVHGLEDMVVAALVVGFARAITVVLNDGHIMDTLIHSAATVLSSVHTYVAVEGMFLFQSTLNVLIPSGSGQAAVTMPLMAPLADVLGLTRQTAVLAFQFGDGLSNTIIPTSGVLMAMLALAKIPYVKWVRFAGPLFLMLSGVAGVFLLIAVAIGYR